jgi:DNA-binding response OmpR family regulator
MLGIGQDRRLPIVLIIDDDMVSREVSATVLTMSGYTVYSAADGAESLSLLDGGTCSPEVILMDAQMPGLSGKPLIEQLRTRTKATLYAISGSDATNEVKAAADGFLLKPFGPEALQRLLETHSPEISPTLADNVPVVRSETLAQLRGMMPDKAVREIYAAIVIDLDKRMTALKAAVNQGDVAEVRRIGHSIKGGCGMAGAAQAARLGALLESGSDDLDNSKTILKELRAAARNLQRMLDAEFPA